LNPQHPTDKAAILNPIQPGSIRAWMLACRLPSLALALGPVLVGGSLAYLRTGGVNLIVAFLALCAAMLMQLITNLQNDLGYMVRGAARAGAHSGLPRASVNGWLSTRQLRGAICLLGLLATAIGVTLVAYRGWPVLAIGGLSLLAALAYMGGPRPIAYTPLGELTVLLFFGLIAVLGTDWLLSGGSSVLSVLAALALGSLAAAALAVNNQRDVAHDRSAGRRTFAVCFGSGAAQTLFSLLLALAFVLLPFMAGVARAPLLLLPWVLLPRALRIRYDFAACRQGSDFNLILLRSFQLGLHFALLLAFATLLSRFAQ